MRALLIALLLLLACCSNAYTTYEKSCIETAMTQSDMNRCASIEFEEADRELNRVYQSIMSRYKAYPVFLQRLKSAQRIWIKLRDADLEMRFPHSDDAQFEYGSIYPLCVNGLLTRLTIARIVFLKEWLIGYEEGEMCSGSLIRRDNL